MTRQETGVILDILKTAYPRFYAGADAREMAQTVELWAELFAEDDVALVAAAVKALIAADVREFPPLIGTVKEQLRRLAAPDELTEAGAWALVARAVKNGLYGAREEFDRLPPLVRRLVGGPSQLRDWALMDSTSLHSVVASNFQRSYRAAAGRARAADKLPAGVRVLAGGGGRALPPAGEKENRPGDGAADQRCKR